MTTTMENLLQTMSTVCTTIGRLYGNKSRRDHCKYELMQAETERDDMSAKYSSLLDIINKSNKMLKVSENGEN